MPKFTVDTDRGTVTPQGGCLETFVWSLLALVVVATLLGATVRAVAYLAIGAAVLLLLFKALPAVLGLIGRTLGWVARKLPK